MNQRKLLFSVTASDCRWDYYRGSGKGGQKRNKTSNCARCTHEQSGAVGKSEEGRSQLANRRRAFRRMAESSCFVEWCRIEAARVTGELEKIERRVESEIENIRCEVHDVNGRWVEVRNLAEKEQR